MIVRKEINFRRPAQGQSLVDGSNRRKPVELGSSMLKNRTAMDRLEPIRPGQGGAHANPASDSTQPAADALDGCADDAIPLRWGKRTYRYHGKHLGTGNRCGHNPQQFATERLALPEVNGGHRIQVLTRLMKKAQAYFDDPASVPLLAYLSGKRNRDGSPRQNRSEGREAQGLIMVAMFAAMDLKSLRVGSYNERGEFIDMPFSELANRCGLARLAKDPQDPSKVELVPCSRFWRGVEWLKRAGVMEVFEKYEETPDGKRGRPAIKHVSEKFLRVLGGLTKAAMKKARDKSSHKVAKYLAGATHAGVQGIEEREALSDDIRSARVKRELFPKPAIKNQMPREVVRDNSADSLQGDYSDYVKAYCAKIVAELGVTMREVSMRFAKYGGLTADAWARQRLNR